MTHRVVLLGAGGMARDVLDAYESLEDGSGRAEIVGLVVEDAYFTPGSSVHGVPVLGGLGVLTTLRSVRVITVVGDPELRRRLVEAATAAGLQFDSVIHRDATVSASALIGAGVAILAGVRVAADVRLGDHVSIHANATVGHDVVCDDYSTVLPGAILSGAAHVGPAATLGAGAIVLPGISVGGQSLVGAGAVVTKDVSEGDVVVGIPARSARRHA